MLCVQRGIVSTPSLLPFLRSQPPFLTFFHTSRRYHPPLFLNAPPNLLHQGGKLLLCDFPGCPRVYHQTCVLTTFPGTLGEDLDADVDAGPWGLLTKVCFVT